MIITGQLLTQGIISGLCLGGTYILIGLGLTLILSVMKIMQFAHGEIYMLGAFTVFYFAVMNGVNLYVAIFLAMIITAIVGLIIERVLLRPLQGNFLACVCVTTGLSLILQTAVVKGFGLAVKQIPNLWPGAFRLLGLSIPKDRFLAVIISLALTLTLYIFLKKSKYGQAIVASAQHPEGALMQGINPHVMAAMVMAIGSGLAAVGGAIGGSIFNLDPYMGGMAFLKGIIIIVIGGMGSIPGVVVGGLILGISDTLVVILLGSQMALIIPLILVIAILIIKPQGLFGHE
jgi:branched-chain amino acid transport system permease protein